MCRKGIFLNKMHMTGFYFSLRVGVSYWTIPSMGRTWLMCSTHKLLSLSNVSPSRRDRIYLARHYFAQQKYHNKKIKGAFKEIKVFFCLVDVKKAFGHIIILVLTQQRKPEELLHQTFQSDWIRRMKGHETFCLFLYRFLFRKEIVVVAGVHNGGWTTPPPGIGCNAWWSDAIRRKTCSVFFQVFIRNKTNKKKRWIFSSSYLEFRHSTLRRTKPRPRQQQRTSSSEPWRKIFSKEYSV